MNSDFMSALSEIEKDKGISKDTIFDALESALVSSYKKNFGTSQNVKVSIDRDTGKIKLLAEFNVVDEVENELLEISVTEAKIIDPKFEAGDIVSKEIRPAKFGRIAAQTAKQVVVQRIKDAERDVIFQDYIDRECEMITGQIQRINRNNVYIDLGKTEAILPPSEQIEGEIYEQGDRLKLYILEVKKTTKGPQIILSRSHPGLIKRLFEIEVPEIHDGIVEIFSVAREAGSRSKIAVFSKDTEVDPLGACVGFKGSRVKAIVDSLYNEKIDIIVWDKKISQFIANALSPSQVIDVIVNEKEKSALVIVPDFQLSLAIGKEGQNARLAAKLTNWKIDIKSESQFDEYYDSLSEEEQELLDNMMNRENGFEDEIINTAFLERIGLHDENEELQNESEIMNDEYLNDIDNIGEIVDTSLEELTNDYIDEPFNEADEVIKDEFID